MRFDVRNFVKISNLTMIWLVVCHVVLFWLTVAGIKLSMNLRVMAEREVPDDIGNASFPTLAAWAVSVTLYYVFFAVSFANLGVSGFFVSQWIKTQGWYWPALWSGIFYAIYGSLWLHWWLQSLITR